MKKYKAFLNIPVVETSTLLVTPHWRRYFLKRKNGAPVDEKMIIEDGSLSAVWDTYFREKYKESPFRMVFANKRGELTEPWKKFFAVQAALPEFLTDRPELAAISQAALWFHIIDTADISGNPAGTSKKFSYANLLANASDINGLTEQFKLISPFALGGSIYVGQPTLMVDNNVVVNDASNPFRKTIKDGGFTEAFFQEDIGTSGTFYTLPDGVALNFTSDNGTPVHQPSITYTPSVGGVDLEVAYWGRVRTAATNGNVDVTPGVISIPDTTTAYFGGGNTSNIDADFNLVAQFDRCEYTWHIYNPPQSRMDTVKMAFEYNGSQIIGTQILIKNYASGTVPPSPLKKEGR